MEKRADESAENAEPAAHEQAAGSTRFLVHQLSLDDGRVGFRDTVPAQPVDLEFGPVTVSVQELNTLPDRPGQMKGQNDLDMSGLVLSDKVQSPGAAIPAPRPEA